MIALGTDPHMESGATTGTKSFAAVDLGASSGRVMLGRVGPDLLDLTEAHRFANRPARIHDTLHWDVLSLYQGVLDGLRAAGERAGGRLDSVGIDGWAVDYGLLDADGDLIGNPVHYRDARTDGMAEKLWKVLTPRDLYLSTGIQYAPFNTLYQLMAAKGSAQYAAAERVLLVPDLIAYWLTGRQGTEITNASTTQLIDPMTRQWAYNVAVPAGIDLSLFPPLRTPGDPAGELLPQILEAVGLAGPVAMTTVASHDTASAVAAVPARPGERFAYISTGTWSLAGLELDTPVVSDESREANFTNELGVDDTVRFLRNIMGLWLLQECMSEWELTDIGSLLAAAADIAPLRSIVDAADPTFLAPGQMPSRIAQACRDSDQPVPVGPAETTRCILDSLAIAHRRAIEDAQKISNEEVDVVYIVGGGSRNALLCQLTADACGLPVVAGPAEASALGNVLVQARAHGVVGDLASMRELLVRTQSSVRYEPDGTHAAAWDEAAKRVSASR